MVIVDMDIDGPGIRDDGWVEAGTDVPTFYDPLLSKLIAWGEDRPQAVARMRRALDEYEVRGIRTSLPFFRWLLVRPELVEARFHTCYLDDLLQTRAGKPFGDVDPSLEEVAAVAVCLVEASRSGKLVTPTEVPANRDHERARPDARTWKARARAESLRA
jgi:acetyl/propionyl-CoA carboxylase alpha subunit